MVQAAVSLTGWSEEGSDTLGFRERGEGGGWEGGIWEGKEGEIGRAHV